MTSSPTIRIKRPRDPFEAQIRARIAAKKRGERVEPEPLPSLPIGTEALHDCAGWIRANSLGAAILEIC